MAADRHKDLGCLNDEKDLEEGEIDDLEEGEIDDDFEGTSEYSFSAKEEKIGSEIAHQTEHNNSHPKSQCFSHKQRNSNRSTKYTRDKDGKREDTHSTWNYEKVGRNRAVSKQNFAGKRSHENVLRAERYRLRGEAGWYDKQSFDSYRNARPALSPEPNEDFNEPMNDENENEDFKVLLEEYKHIQEKLDELGPGPKHGRSLVDDIIDDTFVDVPLDDVRTTSKPSDNLDAEIRELELELTWQANTQTTSENTTQFDNASYPQVISTLSQNIPTTYGGPSTEQPYSGVFEPFKIQSAPKKVRSLSELNRIDMATRGLPVENDVPAKVTTNARSKAKGRSKGKRRPSKGLRQRVRRDRSSDRSGSKVSSSDIYDELGVGIKKSQGGGNNGSIMIRKQKLKEWHRLQRKGNDMEKLQDDYIPAPMDVETVDSAESVGIIDEQYPRLPLIDLPQPPPPGEEMDAPSTSNIMPLMDVKPYGYYHDYGSPWWGGPELPFVSQPYFVEQSTTLDDQGSDLPLPHEEAKIQVPQNHNAVDIRTSEQNSPDNNEADTDVEDEASELALREQLLKSMVSKRAAKSTGKASEKSVTSSVASPSNSRAASPFPGSDARREIQEPPKSDTVQRPSAMPVKVNFAPPKHGPVVIHLGADSEDSESGGESPIKNSSIFFGGLDSFLKEARERSSNSKPDAKAQMVGENKNVVKPPTPTTPEVVSVLSEEKRNEYKKLKLQLALKEQQQKVLGVNRKGNTTEEADVKKSEPVAANPERKHIAKPKVQKDKQKAVVQLQQRLLGLEAQTRHQQEQRKLQKPQQQRETRAKEQQRHPKQQTQMIEEEQVVSNKSKQDQDAAESVKVRLKMLREMLLGHKRLIGEDQKLLGGCTDQLKSSSKALEEYDNRIALLQQQLQRTERLKKVQQELVNKLKIQKTKINQQISKRQSDARGVEERLLRMRALLVSQKSKAIIPTKKSEKSVSEIKPAASYPGHQTPAVASTGEKPLAEVKPTVFNHGHDSQDHGVTASQSTSKNLTNYQEVSRILEESLSPKTQEVRNIPSPKNDFSDKDPNNSSESNRQTSSQTDQTMEMKRLRILEQKLAQKLRQSNARRQIEKETRTPRDQDTGKSGSPRKTTLTEGDGRPSSDSELTLKNNSNLRELTPPVELAGASGEDEVDGVVTNHSVWDVFKDVNKLNKVKQIQVERETNGPNFSNASDTLALPVRFSSTQCAWLKIDGTSFSQTLVKLSGCLSPAVNKPLITKAEVVQKTQWKNRATGRYKSPLVYFRSYRFSPYYRTKKGYTLDSSTFTHLINPRVSFCPFALQGICSDPECTHQHPDDVIPKNRQILEDLAAYFAPAGENARGSDQTTKAIAGTIDAVTKQYGDKVSPAELRVLFVNHLRKQKSASIFNIILERRPWEPISHAKKEPIAKAQNDSPIVQTENTFSWKSWRRKIQNEIKTWSGDRDECQEIRYFSENYDSIKTLEKATEENPCNESLWIRLAMVHMGSNRTEGDRNNNNRKNLDRALNTLVKALEYNRHSERLWLKYLDVFRQRAGTDELYEVCEEAVELAGSYNVWWAYLEIAMEYDRKVTVCLKCIEYLILSETEVNLKSHRLLEIFLYLVQLDLHGDFYEVAMKRFQVVLNFEDVPRDTCGILVSVAGGLTGEDLSLLWLCYIHLVEFSCIPREFYDPARTGPARIVCKDGVIFPWKPGAGTRHGFSELLKLFHSALKECGVVSCSSDKVTPVFLLFKNLISLERASGKNPSSIRTCQRLLKAYPKKIELWSCLSALQQVSDNEGGAANVYKKAVETCDGHAQIVYHAAKYFMETKNRKECYEVLETCVYSKFILEIPSPGPNTRARSHEKPTILRPNPELLFKKLLSQTIPLDSVVPSAKTGTRSDNFDSEKTYIWLCYCIFIELFSKEEARERHSLTQAAYQSAIYSTGDRNEVKTMWVEYLYYMARMLVEKLCTSEELHDVFHKCLSTVPAVTPVNYMSSKSWSDYSFHNKVLALYRCCLGDAFSSSVYQKYLEMFPDNTQLAIQAVESLYKNKELDKSRKILSAILLKTPYCLELWKIAISIELKERNIDQARQLYEHATEALPLSASIWKDFAMFELTHGSSDMEGLKSIACKARERGINLDEYLKELSSKNR
ncbi:zinc finger C3H1 domain-containing protein-like [Dendronephthya gigantea]|uniref:zinc finger C3H1 domain-containing protein-like n=1 Tax=Dendronephthya gigantea TaxID=151771 RepID=UPI00106B1DED|nr:zinc finger C3H1 domain-containing protein-like [Dendronephthya gigantea]